MRRRWRRRMRHHERLASICSKSGICSRRSAQQQQQQHQHQQQQQQHQRRLSGRGGARGQLVDLILACHSCQISDFNIQFTVAESYLEVVHFQPHFFSTLTQALISAARLAASR